LNKSSFEADLLLPSFGCMFKSWITHYPETIHESVGWPSWTWPLPRLRAIAPDMWASLPWFGLQSAAQGKERRFHVHDTAFGSESVHFSQTATTRPSDLPIYGDGVFLPVSKSPSLLESMKGGRKLRRGDEDAGGI
jgi:hypothetical protein